MSDTSDGPRSVLLDRLNKEASVPLNTADSYSIRAWLTSAKKCLDQAEEDVRENDVEAAYVNYVKAISIVVEVIPQHKGMKELEEKRTVQAQEYWIFRNRVSIAFEKVKRLQEQIREREITALASSAANGLRQNNWQNRSLQTDSARTPSPSSSSFSATSTNSSGLKIPRKRPVLSTADSHDLPASSNGVPSRPSSTSSSGNTFSRLPQTPPIQSSDRRFKIDDIKSGQSTQHSATLPKANVIEASSLLSYLTLPEGKRPSILFLDMRPKERYEQGCLNAEHVVWIDPILLTNEISGKALEESLVLCPGEQQDWFSNRHVFDLVVIYDEESRVNSYAGGPVLDIHQVRLRNLTVAIFDFAGYLKPLKHVPMLLVGGIRAWCNLVRENPLRFVRWDTEHPTRAALRQSQVPSGKSRQFTELGRVERKVDELDLEAESQWLESLHTERGPIQRQLPKLDTATDQKKLNRSMVISSPSSDPYNKSLLDFFQKFPNVEPESMSGVPQSLSRPNSLERPRYPSTIAPVDGSPLPQRRQSTFIDHPWHGFTEVKDPEFQPPTPTKKAPERPSPSQAVVPSPSLAAGEDAMYSSGRSRIPSMGSQVSQIGPVSAGLTGLKNLGNTCYMNSVLQCMSATTPLARYFLSGSYRRSINVQNPLGSKGMLANSFAELIKHLWGDQYTHISPISLRTVVGKLQPRFKNSDQQDAQDFLTFFLDGLHEDLNENALKSKLRELTPDEEKRRERMPLADISNIEWDRYKHNHNSFLVELFQGQFTSSLRCSVCGQTSTTCNAFMNLSVEISLPHGPQGLKLTQCIDAFVKEEVLEGENAWNCPTCKRPQRATKQLRISRLPTILVVHLKRFHYAGPWRDKLNTFIDYPMQNLDLTKYVLGGSEASRGPNPDTSQRYLYDLYAVTNHFGTLSGGHYTATIHNKLRGKWYVFDDSRVSPCDDTSVVVYFLAVKANDKGRAGYILWYKRNNQF